jgi:hypothetical protein
MPRQIAVKAVLKASTAKTIADLLGSQQKLGTSVSEGASIGTPEAAKWR